MILPTDITPTRKTSTRTRSKCSSANVTKATTQTSRPGLPRPVVHSNIIKDGDGHGQIVVAAIQDVATVGPARQRAPCVVEDGSPFAKAEVGGNDDAAAVIRLSQQVEEQRTSFRQERKVAWQPDTQPRRSISSSSKVIASQTGTGFRPPAHFRGHENATISKILFDRLTRRVFLQKTLGFQHGKTVELCPYCSSSYLWADNVNVQSDRANHSD